MAREAERALELALQLLADERCGRGDPGRDRAGRSPQRVATSSSARLISAFM